jgi:hypothetical protein
MFYFRLLISLCTTGALKYGASPMRRIRRRATTTRNPNIRVVLVDALKQQMTDLRILRKKVAEAERLAESRVDRPVTLQRTP